MKIVFMVQGKGQDQELVTIETHEDRCVPQVGEAVSIDHPDVRGSFYVDVRDFTYEITKIPVVSKNEDPLCVCESWRSTCRIWLKEVEA